MPVPLTSFVGRSTEVADLVAAVSAERLVTALGPGGVGKTRLATAVAAAVSDRWRDGVWFVDLVPVTDEALVPAAVSRTLGLADSPGRSSEEHVLAHLADREALLVLDNCEHLAGGVGVFVERVLGRCPGVAVLATSQARLMLPFERVFAVPGLSLPSEGGQGDAVSLFLERAGQAGVPPSPRPTGRGSARSAAASTAAPSPSSWRRRGCPPSDSTGSSAASASGSTCCRAGRGSTSATGRSARRSTGATGCSTRPTRPSCGASRSSPRRSPPTRRRPSPARVRRALPGTVTPRWRPVSRRLAEHSLLVTAPGEQTRHRVLDSIRQYGLARMAETTAPDGADAADELSEVRRRHHAWATAEVEALHRRADIPLGEALARTGEFAAWRDDFDRVADDARAALLWAHHADLRAETFTLAEVLASACFTRGLLGESQRRYEQAVEHAPSPMVAAEVQMEAAGAASSRHVGNDALRLWRAAAATARDSGEVGTAAYALARAAELLIRGPGIIADKPPEGTQTTLLDEARALGSDDPRALAAIETAVAFDLEEVDPAALAAAERAVAAADALGDPILVSASLDALTAVKLGIGDLDGAVAATRRRMDVLAGLRASATSAFEVGDGYHMASEIALAAGDFARARRYAEMSDHVSFHSEEGHLATSRLLKVDALAGELDRVLENAERFRQGWEDAGRPVASNLAGGSYAVAMAHGLRGDDEARQEWVDITRALGVDLERLIGCQTGFTPAMDAIVSLHRGEAEAAEARLAVDPTEFNTWYTGEWRTWYTALYVEAAVLAGSPDARDRIERLRPIAHPNGTVVALFDRAEALLDGDTERLASVAAALEGSGCRYQWARTLVLAGGDLAERGRREMAALGAAPMAEPAAG